MQGDGVIDTGRHIARTQSQRERIEVQRLFLQAIAEKLKASTKRQLPAGFRITRLFVRVFVQITLQFEQQKRRIGRLALLQLCRNLRAYREKSVRRGHPASQ